MPSDCASKFIVGALCREDVLTAPLPSRVGTVTPLTKGSPCNSFDSSPPFPSHFLPPPLQAQTKSTSPRRPAASRASADSATSSPTPPSTCARPSAARCRRPFVRTGKPTGTRCSAIRCRRTSLIGKTASRRTPLSHGCRAMPSASGRLRSMVRRPTTPSTRVSITPN